MKLSLIVPCYNEEQNIRPFYDAVCSAFEHAGYDYELVFVNDGSRDGTIRELKYLHETEETAITILNFSRNFGKEAAIYAGLQAATGEYLSLIDADLQQRPEIVADMVRILDEHEEYDCVTAYQENRKEGKVMTWFKDSFYKVINKMCEIDFVSGASDFRTFRRCVADAVLSLPEYDRFSKGIFSWIGFETHYIPYTVEERYAGETKWSFWKLVKYAIQGMVSFSTFPLKLATFFGGLVSALAILYMIVVIIQKIVFSIDLPGYPTIIVLILLLGGLQLMILGILGEYLARDYIQGKKRPIYVLKSRWSYDLDADEREEDKNGKSGKTGKSEKNGKKRDGGKKDGTH